MFTAYTKLHTKTVLYTGSRLIQHNRNVLLYTVIPLNSYTKHALLSSTKLTLTSYVGKKNTEYQACVNFIQENVLYTSLSLTLCTLNVILYPELALTSYTKIYYMPGLH